jgi:hypothetical protein
MLTIHQPEETGNQMASAPIPKHGFSSPGCDGRRLPNYYFRRVTCPQRAATVIDRVSILRTPSVRERITKMNRSEMLLVKPSSKQIEGPSLPI